MLRVSTEELVAVTEIELNEAIATVVAGLDFGTASARKSGRNSKYPHAPIIKREFNGRGRTEQILGLAYAERDQAIAAAQHVINARRTHFEKQLHEPRMRAMREQHGLPREI